MELKNIPFNKIWVFDIETDNLLAKCENHWLSVFKNVGTNQKVIIRDKQKSFKFMKQILDTDGLYLSGHNISSFDIPAMYKLCSRDNLFDMFKYGDKLIDTLLLGQLLFPKFAVEKLAESRIKISNSFDRQSHSLKFWGLRVGGEDQKLEFNDFSKYTKEMEVYCEADVDTNIAVLKWMLTTKRAVVRHPSMSLLKLESTVAMYGGVQTINGHRLDVAHLDEVHSKAVQERAKIDLQLVNAFDPYWSREKPAEIENQLAILTEKFKLNNMVDIIKKSKDGDNKELLVIVKRHMEDVGKPSENTTEEDIARVMKGYFKIQYKKPRNASKWIEVDINTTPRSILETLVCPVAYYKNGKPKVKKIKNFIEREDGSYDRKINIKYTELKTDIELITYKPNSRVSLVTFFERKYNIFPPALTDSGGYKLDDYTFGLLADVVEEAPLLQKRFKVQKLISECETLQKNIVNGRIHHSLNTNATSTGRMSSNNISLQNINSSTNFRKIFISNEGQKFNSADLSSAELFLLGVYLQPFDNGIFLEAVVHGKKEDKTDIHNINATKGGVSRSEAKVLIYSILYKASPLLVGHNLWTKEVAEKCKKKYTKSQIFNAKEELYSSRNTTKKNDLTFRRVKKDFWLEVTDELAMKSLYGGEMSESFKDGIKGLKELEDWLQEQYDAKGYVSIGMKKIWFKDGRTSLNYLLQGSNAYITKLWAYYVVQLLGYYKIPETEFMPLTIVHDEINFSSIERWNTINKIAIDLANKVLGFKYPIAIESFSEYDWSFH